MIRPLSILAVAASLTVGCSTANSEKAASSRASLTSASGETKTLRWGRGAGEIGYRKAGTEHLAMGPTAVAVDGNGELFVLDALNERVVRLERNGLAVVANVPRDADDLAIGPDGAIAVRRSVKPEVLVMDGSWTGHVDTSAVDDVDAIALGKSRRVTVTNSFQETFSLGSPSMPQLPAAVRAAKREGAAMLRDGNGVVAVRNESGELEMRVVASDERHEGRVVTRYGLGKGSAARIVGSLGSVVCARVEHASTDSSGAIRVEREAACMDVANGTTVFRTKLPAPGAYVPHRELAFNGGILAFVRPTDDGLEVTTWKPDLSGHAGGAR